MLIRSTLNDLSSVLKQVEKIHKNYSAYTDCGGMTLENDLKGFRST